MGLGTDQLGLPKHLTAVPIPAPRDESDGLAAGAAPLPREQELADLVPWARRMQLPGVDT